MSTFSIKERDDDLFEEVADVSGQTTFLLRGTEGMVTPLWEGTTILSEAGAEGVVDGLSTMVVDGPPCHQNTLEKPCPSKRTSNARHNEHVAKYLP